jgi:N-dimethylarginine dimethylaminohydrolase
MGQDSEQTGLPTGKRERLPWRGIACGGLTFLVLWLALWMFDGRVGLARVRAAVLKRAPAPATVAVEPQNPAPAASSDEAGSPTERPQAPVPSGPEEIVADDGGPIAEIVLQYSAHSEPELGPVFTDLFRQLPAGVRILVCCSTRECQDQFLSKWGPNAVASGREVHIVNVNRPLSVWARDRRIARQHTNGIPAACFVPTAHVNYDDEKHNDMLLPTLLWSTGLVPRVSLTAFHLEGGNVVANRRHVFVGGNVVVENKHRFSGEDHAVEELQRIFHREPLLLKGDAGQIPWCHTDMYITPLSERRVLVASPAAGLGALGERSFQLATDEEDEDPWECDDTSPGSAAQKCFDAVAEEIRARGYEVVRMPALVNVDQDWMVTYNNVLLEEYGDRRVVYMPVYGIPRLDDLAETLYTELGYEVRRIDVSSIFHLGGAVRCLVNVTQRVPTGSDLPATEGMLRLYEIDPPQTDDEPEEPAEEMETIALRSDWPPQRRLGRVALYRGMKRQG